MCRQAYITSFYHAPLADLDDVREARKIKEIKHLSGKLGGLSLKRLHFHGKISQVEIVGGCLLRGAYRAAL